MTDLRYLYCGNCRKCSHVSNFNNCAGCDNKISFEYVCNFKQCSRNHGNIFYCIECEDDHFDKYEHKYKDNIYNFSLCCNCRENLCEDNTVLIAELDDEAEKILSNKNNKK